MIQSGQCSAPTAIPARLPGLAAGIVLSMSLVACGGSDSGGAVVEVATAPATADVVTSAATEGGATLKIAAVTSGSTGVVAPGAPRSVSATPGANSVRLLFAAPASSGSSAVALYTASCSDGTFKFVGSAPASPVTVSGLTQSRNYSCTVRATNNEIDGPASTPIIVNLPAPPAFAGTASAPQNLSVAAGNGSLTFSFTPPGSDGGFPVLGYSASCSGGGAGGSAVSSPIIVSGLRNGTSYSCTVVAINAQGAGALSNSVTGTPRLGAGSATAPGTPLSVSAAAGNGQATISFAAPASNGGAPISSYSASCSNSSSGTLFGSALSSPIVVTGLANGVTHDCSVVATNAYGSSAASASVAVRPAANLVNSALPVASVTVGSGIAALAADGIAAISATLRTANGALYAGPGVIVTFTSRCAAAGKATLDASVVSQGGIAVATYQPKGCTGIDTITAAVSGTALSARATIAVSSAGALSAKAALGKSLFFDRALSASGTVACASCHSPASLFLAANSLPTQPGGVKGQAVGFRSAPTASYAALATAFRFLTLTNQQGSVNNAVNGKLGTPRGGLMWDGRASDVFQQASGPLTGAVEMANANNAAVLTKLLARPYLSAFSAVYGTTSVSSNPDTVVQNIADAIGQYESEERAFMPFNSKFDAVQAGVASFSAQEANGQLAFFNARQGACAGCHTPFSQARAAQSPAMFTDGAYRAIGVPRNWRLPYNDDSAAANTLAAVGESSLLNGSSLGAPNHAFFDLGFCGPIRTDSLLDASTCGAFRTPALRNIAAKGSYDHNGVFGSLMQVIDFYINRDLAPQRIYRKADGTADIPYNDLPTQFQGNIAVRAPFTTVVGGRLSPADYQDLVAFLCTLTDGYNPASPAAYRLPPQCDNAIRR